MTDATHQPNHAPVGNEAHEEYRAPWPERYRFIVNGGCRIFDSLLRDAECTGHVPGLNEWAIDMNDLDRPADADCGDPLRAARSGSTVFLPLGQAGGYGRMVAIRHLAFNGAQTSTWYAHLDQPVTGTWDAVFTQGDWIGSLGTTANGCHLHFQLNFGSNGPPQGGQSSNLVFSGTPGVDGYDLTAFVYNPDPPVSDGNFKSNNTGPGYCRPGAPPNLDPGLATSACRIEMRNFVRNLAVYTVDVGSTKASSRGACGANRWVKSCSAWIWGALWTQGFVLRGYGLEVPSSLVESPSGPPFSVVGEYWKAYGATCIISGTTRYGYEWLGRPPNAAYHPSPSPDRDRQDFQGGYLEKDYSDPANTRMTVVASGSQCTHGNISATNNDPCYDVHTNFVVNSVDLNATAAAFGSETSPAYNDRYDVNRDGPVNSIDLNLVASQFGRSCR